MAEKLSEAFRSKRGTAVLAACIVQTLNESDTTFQERFLERLERAYYEIRDGGQWEGDVVEELELLQWTRELLTGISFTKGSVQIRDNLLTCLDSNDKLFVAKLSGEAAWQGIPPILLNG